MTERQILTVSQLNRQVRMLLETQFPLLWVEGELSNVARPSSGHWYFTLKDAQAQVRCAMFKGRNNRVNFVPREGQHVVLRARVGLYEGRGDFQLIAEHMEEAGFGALQRAFEELKARLAAEGLFAPQHKQALPRVPRHIGVITSPSGAAIHDILTVLQRRYPAVPVTLLPVAVQGAEAPSQIANAIAEANAHLDCDVLIVGRGGGSLEDLWAFNDERVARAIFASHTPVVSAVGHEVDVSIADFVADVRAPTPSAAAELITPDVEDWQQRFWGFEELLTQAIKRRLQSLQQQTLSLRSRLRHPGDRVRENSQRLDQLEIRLHRALSGELQEKAQQLSLLSQNLQHLHPEKTLQLLKRQVEELQDKLHGNMRRKLENRQQQLAQQTALLDSVSPLNTLKRGYAMVLTDSGEVVRRASEVKTGDKLLTRLGEGTIRSTVTGTTS